MAASLGISVGTLRKSLDELTALGLLERVQGSGNYICAQEDTQSVYAFFRVELIEGGGCRRQSFCRWIGCPSPTLAAIRQMRGGHRIRRLRRLNGTPAVPGGNLAGWVVHRCHRRRGAALSRFTSITGKRWVSGSRKAVDRLDLATVPDWAPDRVRPVAGQFCMRATRISSGPEGEALRRPEAGSIRMSRATSRGLPKPRCVAHIT